MIWAVLNGELELVVVTFQVVRSRDSELQEHKFMIRGGISAFIVI